MFFNSIPVLSYIFLRPFHSMFAKLTVTPASFLCQPNLSMPCSILHRVWSLCFRRTLILSLKNLLSSSLGSDWFIPDPDSSPTFNVIPDQTVKLRYFGETWVRSSPNTRDRHVRPGFEPLTSCTLGRHSSKELFEQRTLLLFGTSTVWHRRRHWNCCLSVHIRCTDIFAPSLVERIILSKK